MLNCNEIRSLSKKYANAAKNLNGTQMKTIAANLRTQTQGEMNKLQKSINFTDSKTLASYLEIANGAFISILGLLVLSQLYATLSGWLFLGAGVAATIYGLVGQSKVEMAISYLKGGDGKQMTVAFGKSVSSAVALVSAEEVAKGAGKTVLVSLIKFGTALKDVYDGISAVANGTQELTDLDRKLTKMAGGWAVFERFIQAFA